MNEPQPSKTHGLTVPAVVVVSIATAGLPLLAMAWQRSRIMLDGFGMEISPAAQWLMSWQTPAFLVIASLCVSAVAMLGFYARNRVATLAAIAIAIGAILAETAIAVSCMIQPFAKLVRDLS